MAGSLAPVMHYPVWRLTVRCRAVAIAGGDATGQDPLDSAAVEPFEDLGTHAKSFQSPEGEKRVCRALVCLDHDSPLVMWTPRNLKLLRISVADMLFPPLTTWGQPIRESRIQLQREVFRPRVFSLVMSFVVTMVLNTEL